MKENLVNKYTAFLNEKEQERKALINAGTKERAEIENRIKGLEERMENPNGIEDYKEAAQELRDSKQYLEYLKTASSKVNQGILTETEYKELRENLLAEIREKQEKTAPEIQKKLFEVIALMDEYTAGVKEREDVINRAQALYSPKLRTGSYTRGKIREYNPDKFGYWEAFCTMYFQHYDTAQKIKAGAKKNAWSKLPR